MYAKVAVARPILTPLTYRIPVNLLDTLTMGHVVLVPLGRGAGETGYVLECVDEPDFDPKKIKSIIRLLDDEPAFSASQLHLFKWMADYYMVSLGQVIRTALPAEIHGKVLRVLEPTEGGIEALTDGVVEGEQGLVLREIVARPRLTLRGLSRRLSDEIAGSRVQPVVKTLVKKEWVGWGEREVANLKALVSTVGMEGSLPEALEKVPRAGAVMRVVLALLSEIPGMVDIPDLVSRHGSNVRGAIKRLEAAGAVTTGQREKRDVLADAQPWPDSPDVILNDDQERALQALNGPDRVQPFLLYGVTGSGKTEVFLRAAKYALDQGQQVLVLVPEIGLTPQLVGRFRARFGLDVAVLHSGLSGSQRLGQWRRIRAGEASLAIGARSALFAPFNNLGLIVVDEEHDDSYKQDEGVPYCARDLAVVLGQQRACPVVLASATPSLESWHNAKQKRYRFLKLANRATPKPVPHVEIVDLTQLEVEEGAERPILAPEVVVALRETFAADGKAIVLYNRRGYATMVHCTQCGATHECPNCGITLTLHKAVGRLSCHYCGLRRTATDQCVACGSDTIEELGKGTERVSEVLKTLFPNVRQSRMDADTTSVRGAHHEILQAFRDGHTQLLVGTQIVAKGHDFPDVHTAVVISADRGFRLPDFRAAERTFSLLVQLAGRAGRGDVPGRVFVQTWNPSHYVLTHLNDISGFLTKEMRIRDTLAYPPFTRLCMIRFSGVQRDKVQRRAKELAQELRRLAKTWPGVSVMGPAPAALPKLVGRWRYQLVLRGQNGREFRRFMRTSRPRLDKVSGGGVRVNVDVDPRHLM